MDCKKPDHNINYQDQIMPCPFCGSKGGEKLLIGYIPNKEVKYGIYCTNCDVTMTNIRIDKLILVWNKRIDLQPGYTPEPSRVKERKNEKEIFIKQNWVLYKKIVDNDNSQNDSHPDFNTFITKARTEIGYSEKTLSGDIFRSFMRIAQNIKIQPPLTTE